MINIVNLPSTPTDFFATPTIHIQTFTFILSPEDINNEHAELLQARKEIKRSLSSPALFEYPKMTTKVHYLPDGRKTHNGQFEQSQSDVLWTQLLKRSLSKQILSKIEDMIESPMEVSPGYETVKLLTSSNEKLSPQSSLAQSDVLWEQLLKRSLSKQILNKIEDMIESPMEVSQEYETVKLLTSDEKISPQSSLGLEENIVVSNNEPNFSQTFPQTLNACMWLIRKPSKSKREELKRQQLEGPVKF